MKKLFLLAWISQLTGCSSIPPETSSVHFGGPIWQEGQRRAQIFFQDGGQSFAVPGGTLWTFGDTFFGQAAAGTVPTNKHLAGSVSATLAWLPAEKHSLPPTLSYLTGADGRARSPLTLFPEEDPKHLRLWPLDGISIGRKIYLFYAMVATTDAPGPWNFHGVGAGLAVAGGPMQAFTRLRPDGNCHFPISPIQVLREGEWLYLYEISDQPKGLVLARVGVNHIEQPAEYQFFTGQAWDTNRARATVILREAYGQVSIAWVSAMKSYVMATSSDFSHPHEIQLRTSSQPGGPWQLLRRVAIPEIPGKQTELVYCTFLHPELSRQNSGQLVLTFCRILKGVWELSNPEWMTLQLRPENRKQD